MSHPLIAPNSPRSGLNTLLHAAPNAGAQSAPGFEAALEHARRQENPSSKSVEHEHNTEQASAPAREAHQPPNAPPGNDSPPAQDVPEHTARGPAENAVDDTADPAGVPAEIAALFASLSLADVTPGEETALTDEHAGGRGRLFGRLADGILTAFADSRGARGDASEATLRLVTLTGNANAGERGISLGLAELPDFTAPNADPSHSTRNGGPSAVGLSFAPRLEAAQQLPQLPITVSPGHRGWAAEVGNQVSWMVGRSEARAELQLTPPSLGKLGVSIQVNGDQTTAQFVAASQAARDALEQAMPRLREVLQQAGIELGETHVSTSHEQSSARDDESAPRAGNFTRNDDAEAPASPLNVPPIRSGSGLVDTFA